MSNGDRTTPKVPTPDATLEAQVQKRFGVLPNFFRLGSDTPEIRANLWGFAQAAYLDNPLPSVFKERLFVHLSRFCEVRYCIARHAGFLLGLGYPAGDPRGQRHSIEDVVRLLERPVEREDDLKHLLSLYADRAVLETIPGMDSQIERAIFSFASHVFLQTREAPTCLEALRKLFGAVRFQYLLLLLVFVRSAHYWTEIHPELVLEDDIEQLLTVHQALANCVLREPETGKYEVRRRLLDELVFLRQQAEQNERLRTLTNQMLQMQDAERRNIARELHDSTGQIMALLNMNLSKLSRQIPLNPELRESVEICLALASEANTQLRTVSYLLHPPLLDEIGLAAALEAFAEGVRRRSGIAVNIELPPNFARLPSDLELALFRVVQEAITNVLKHAGSDKATIRISLNQEELLLDVEDNGKGVPPEKMATLNRQSGVGLAGMKERVRPFGGVLDIRSNSSGTKVTAVIPLSGTQEPNQAKATSG